MRFDTYKGKEIGCPLCDEGPLQCKCVYPTCDFCGEGFLVCDCVDVIVDEDPPSIDPYKWQLFTTKVRVLFKLGAGKVDTLFDELKLYEMEDELTRWQTLEQLAMWL